MIKSSIILFLTCFILYLPFSREPDYFDSETAPAVIFVYLDEDLNVYSSKNKNESTWASPTRSAVNFIEISANCELNAMFDDPDVEVSTVCSEDSDNTDGNVSFSKSP